MRNVPRLSGDYFSHLSPVAAGIPGMSVYSHLIHARGTHPPAPYMKARTRLELPSSCSSPGDEGSAGGCATTPGGDVSLVCLSHSTTSGGSWFDPYVLFLSFFRVQKPSFDHRTQIYPVLMLTPHLLSM